MNHDTTLSQEIETEYEAYLQNPYHNLDSLYEKLSVFMKRIITRHLSWRDYVDENLVDELTQEALLAIIERGIDSFEKKEAKFSTYCGVIAKNKATDWIRKNQRVVVSSDEEIERRSESLNVCLYYDSPEKKILELEYKLEQIAMVKKYLKLLMDWPQKPYRTVSCCYTMVLFQKYHPATKELTSPKWAFQKLEKDSVQKGADSFIAEMEEWFPDIFLVWGFNFIEAMFEKENGTYISNMVFGENFQVKDFENWSRRLQPKIKKCLLETVDKGEFFKKD